MEIIFYIIFGLVFLGLCGYVAYNTYKNIPKNSVSFKESLDLVELPVVTFNCGKKKLNLILDTGASTCVIDKRVLEGLKEEDYIKTNKIEKVWGMEGNPKEVNIVNVKLTYSNLEFLEDFLVNDLSDAFDNIKQECGVKLHGIIGSNFFTKHKYILDFDKMMFYNRK